MRLTWFVGARDGPVGVPQELAHGGRGGIRTHDGLAPMAVFKTAALNHSATLPTRTARAGGLPVPAPSQTGKLERAARPQAGLRRNT
jgi:hypothetical protein